MDSCPQYNSLSPVGKEALYMTSNGTMFIALSNSTMFTIFKSDDYGLSFTLVLTVNEAFDMWNWLETTNGTLFLHNTMVELVMMD